MATNIARIRGRKTALHLALYVIVLVSAYTLGFYSLNFLIEIAKTLDPKAEFPSPAKRSSLPDRWESYTVDQMYEHYGCKAQQSAVKEPIPSLAQWLFLRKQYKEYVDDTIVFDDPVSPTLGYSFDESHNPPPFYAKVDPGRGRGLYASRDIKKFEVVHHWSGHDVIFPDAYAFRQFVFSLPKSMACSVVDWAWSRKMNDKGKDMICLSINIASLMNAGDQNQVNVGITTSTSDAFYATRDIKKDEEILTRFIRT